MPVFTIYCCGTAFNRNSADELVATFAALTAGNEVRPRMGGHVPLTGTHLILEGPGSDTGNGAVMPGLNNPLLGVAKADANAFIQGVIDLAPRGAHADFIRSFYGEINDTPLSQLTAKANGTGWHDNVLRAVSVVANLHIQPTVVNILGWSRGAVTALRIANRMWEVFGAVIRVNLFLIDPVHGQYVSRAVEDTRLPPNVARARIILAVHDVDRPLFDPQDASVVTVQNAAATSLIWLPMAGNHSAQVLRTGQGALEAAWRCTWGLARDCLLGWGTVFNDGIGAYAMTPLAYALAYARMKALWPAAGHVRNRGFVARLHQYVDDPTLYVNNHHERVFSQAFPQVYRVLHGAARRWAPGELATETEAFHTTVSQYADLMLWLQATGKIVRSGRLRKIQPAWIPPTAPAPVLTGAQVAKARIGKLD